MIHIIENEHLYVEVDSMGAELCKITHKRTNAPLLWTAQDPWPRHAPILFPYCGRLINGKFSKDGIEYEGAPHGFARDIVHIMQDKTPTSVTLKLEANVLTMEKWPFAFGLTSKFELDGNTLHHKIEIVNDDDDEMTFGFGYHPGFVCPFDENHTSQDYEIVFDTAETPVVIETDAESGLVTGQKYNLFENETSFQVSDTMFDKGSICLSGLKSKTLSIVEKGTGRKMVFNIENFPYVLLWSMPGTLKYMCVEPWHTLPDEETSNGVWADKKPSLLLKPEESFNTCMSMTFEL